MVLIDTSVLFAIVSDSDSQHKKSLEALNYYTWDEIEIFDHIYAETLNVLRRKVTDQDCRQFLDLIVNKKIIITPASNKAISFATSIFFEHKKLSFTDALLIATAYLSRQQILTFDENLLRVWRSIS